MKDARRAQRLFSMALAATFVLGLTADVSAQARDTGVMVVRAAGPDDVPLPGVAVVARGPVGSQTQYTWLDGSARFPGL